MNVIAVARQGHRLKERVGNIRFRAGDILLVQGLEESLAEALSTIIVLLAAMIPVGQALEATGGAKLIADLLLVVGSDLPIAGMLALIMVSTMLLSNVVNNAAAAIIVAPIAISLSNQLELSVDPVLMAVAIGASCAFLTPIGHQSNALVMEPGGYRFGDYWRLGLPLSILVVVVSIPVILWVWT